MKKQSLLIGFMLMLVLSGCSGQSAEEIAMQQISEAPQEEIKEESIPSVTIEPTKKIINHVNQLIFYFF